VYAGTGSRTATRSRRIVGYEVRSDDQNDPQPRLFRNYTSCPTLPYTRLARRGLRELDGLPGLSGARGVLAFGHVAWGGLDPSSILRGPQNKAELRIQQRTKMCWIGS